MIVSTQEQSITPLESGHRCGSFEEIDCALGVDEILHSEVFFNNNGWDLGDGKQLEISFV